MARVEINGRPPRATTYRAYRLMVRKITGMALGVETGEVEHYIDPRDGMECTRPKLAFLPRSRVAVMPGSTLREGNVVVIDVPSWLATKIGLRNEDLVR